MLFAEGGRLPEKENEPETRERRKEPENSNFEPEIEKEKGAGESSQEAVCRRRRTEPETRERRKEPEKAARSRSSRQTNVSKTKQYRPRSPFLLPTCKFVMNLICEFKSTFLCIWSQC
ncbi:hypothetical protein V2J09_022500 [Rumex salicifolius]